MSEQRATSDKPPTDPRQKCSICGSTDHTTGFHDGGIAPENPTTKSADGFHDGGSAPR
jgi:hypothetical protein